MDTANKTKDFIYPALFAALTIVLGFISIPIPISPSPISGLNLGVMLAGSLLTTRQAAYSMLTIILLGAAGLPVLAGFSGGLGVLLGPRGGFYFGFLLGVIVISSLRGAGSSLMRMLAANIIGGVVVVYIVAVLWLTAVTGMSVTAAFMAGVTPFIIGDMIKVFMASMITVALSRHVTVFRGSNA